MPGDIICEFELTVEELEKLNKGLDDFVRGRINKAKGQSDPVKYDNKTLENQPFESHISELTAREITDQYESFNFHIDDKGVSTQLSQEDLKKIFPSFCSGTESDDIQIKTVEEYYSKLHEKFLSGYEKQTEKKEKLDKLYRYFIEGCHFKGFGFEYLFHSIKLEETDEDKNEYIITIAPVKKITTLDKDQCNIKFGCQFAMTQLRSKDFKPLFAKYIVPTLDDLYLVNDIKDIPKNVKNAVILVGEAEKKTVYFIKNKEFIKKNGKELMVEYNFSKDNKLKIDRTGKVQIQLLNGKKDDRVLVCDTIESIKRTSGESALISPLVLFDYELKLSVENSKVKLKFTKMKASVYESNQPDNIVKLVARRIFDRFKNQFEQSVADKSNQIGGIVKSVAEIFDKFKQFFTPSKKIEQSVSPIESLSNSSDEDKDEEKFDSSSSSNASSSSSSNGNSSFNSNESLLANSKNLETTKQNQKYLSRGMKALLLSFCFLVVLAAACAVTYLLLFKLAIALAVAIPVGLRIFLAGALLSLIGAMKSLPSEAITPAGPQLSERNDNKLPPSDVPTPTGNQPLKHTDKNLPSPKGSGFEEPKKESEVKSKSKSFCGFFYRKKPPKKEEKESQILTTNSKKSSNTASVHVGNHATL